MPPHSDLSFWLCDPVMVLKEVFAAALKAVLPAHVLPSHLPPPPSGRLIIIGAGKAAGAMAQAAETHYAALGFGRVSGIVVTRYGHTAPCQTIKCLEAGHPLPDRASLRAAQAIRQALVGLTPDDHVLCLLSGGGSALLAEPAPGLSLSEKQAIFAALLQAGAPIQAVNTVRKHLSLIKGGRLAKAVAPAALTNLIISDVAGDEPHFVASGPTLPDPSTRGEALALLERYHITIPPSALTWLTSEASETPKPSAVSTLRQHTHIIARAIDALIAAKQKAEAAGLPTIILSDRFEDEARSLAKFHAAIARSIVVHRQPIAPPCLLLSGGEASITLNYPSGSQRGGRNSEFLLALALALGETSGIYALAADTDGIDGSEQNAGAILRPDSLARAQKEGLDAAWKLKHNDSYSFFSELGDLLITGPTRTNVNDFRALLILPQPSPF